MASKLPTACARCWLAALAALAAWTPVPASAPDPAPDPSSDSAPAHAEGEVAEAADGAPAADTRGYVMGPPLNGRFDLTVFYGLHHVQDFRFALGPLRAGIGRERGWVVELALSLEFGNSSGVAECIELESQLREDVENVLSLQQGRALLTTAGKVRLKQDLLAMFNRRLTTARVRQLYLTDFLVHTNR